MSVIELARFVVVGVVNTVFSYVIYAVLLYVGLNYVVANLIALMIGILFSFKTQATLVFHRNENSRLLRFTLVWLMIYGFNILLISRFIALGFDPYVSGALAVPFATVLSYVAQKFFVFRERSVRDID